MRVVLQRVSEASVSVDNKMVGSIDKGLLLLVGITHEDTPEIVNKVAKKCVELRIFEDENGKINLCLHDIDQEKEQANILSISQFTLYADCKKGRRPSYDKAARPELAKELYGMFNDRLIQYGCNVKTGIFGADMKVKLCNDGPVTIILDSDTL